MKKNQKTAAAKKQNPSANATASTTKTTGALVPFQSVSMNIPLDKIDPSPFNLDRTIGEKELRDLADSIAQHGVQTDIKVRPTENGRYEITDSMKAQLDDFYGNYASEKETADTIKAIYEDTGYVIDTHTAVAAAVYKKYTDNSGDKTKTVIASTASPFKFTRSVMDAIDKAKYDSMTDFELVDELSKIANVAVPQAIEDIRTAPVIHNRVCDRTQMEETVRKILGV